MGRTSLTSSDIEMSDGARMQRMPFLSTGRSIGTRFYNYARHFRTMIMFVVIGGFIVWIVDTWGDALLTWSHEDNDDALTPLIDMGQTLHVMIPATGPGVNVCKTVMGLSILNYPTPVLLSWQGLGEETGIQNQIPAKITAALNHVKTFEDDDDLVMMADGMDSWFQLPPDVLRERYFRLIAAADYRMRRRLGRRAVRREEMKQTVVFGATKRCAPNQLSSIACYPIPEPPTPRDMYGNNTDTIMGRSKYTSYRPRYLDAGFMMGPVGDVRAILERAQELVETLPTADILDNGVAAQSPTTLFGGDAQGIFARIFGEQAYQREVIRARYRSWFKKWSIPHTPGSIEGHEYTDILNPDFTHEEMKALTGHPKEYAISLDYTGMLVSNTAHSINDHRSMKLDSVEQQRWNDGIRNRNEFDCKIRLSSELPDEIAKSPWPLAAGTGDADRWRDTKFFGNLCLGNVPVVLHHNNDDKSIRETAWPDVWYQPLARDALATLTESPGTTPGSVKGAHTDKGLWLPWSQLCPAAYDQELFRPQDI